MKPIGAEIRVLRPVRGSLKSCDVCRLNADFEITVRYPYQDPYADPYANRGKQTGYLKLPAYCLICGLQELGMLFSKSPEDHIHHIDKTCVGDFCGLKGTVKARFIAGDFVDKISGPFCDLCIENMREREIESASGSTIRIIAPKSKKEPKPE